MLEQRLCAKLRKCLGCKQQAAPVGWGAERGGPAMIGLGMGL